MRKPQSHSLLPQLITLLLAVSLPFLLITPTIFPFTGIALTFTLLGAATIYFKPKITLRNIFAFAGVLFFSSFLVLRANPLLIFFDILANLSLLSILFLPDNYVRSFWSVFLLPFEAIGKVFQTDNHFPLDLNVFKKAPDSKSLFTPSTIVSVLITLGVLVVVIPLLSASNPIFKNLVDATLQLFDLSDFFTRLFSDNAVVWLVRLGFFLFLLFFVPKALSYAKDHHVWENHKTLISQSLSLLLPKLAVIVIFAIFFITQAQLYFASPEVLKTLGYTNSQATREVFGHLLVVCLVVFGLIYNDRSDKRWNTWTTYALLFGVALMNLMAFKSDFDYTTLFGFTEKRLYGFAVNLWIFGALGIYLYGFVTNHLDDLVKKLGVWFIIVLGIVNILNFDYLIYNVNRARTGEGEDASYLVTLSSDAGSYDKRILAAVELAKTKGSNNFSFERINAYSALSNVDSLRDAKNRNITGFNFSLNNAYHEVRDLDVAKLRNQLDASVKQGQFTASPTPITSPVGQGVTVVLTNITDRFKNQAFHVIKIGESEGDHPTQDGHLANDSFFHTLGPGKFQVMLLVEDGQRPDGMVPTRDMYYIIPDNFSGDKLEIDFSQF